jgi:hypothetical protein
MTTRKPFARMTRAEIEADRRDFFAAMAYMKANGWEHTMSIMDDCGTGGLHFRKGDRTFVMNQDNRHDLPTD